MLKRLTHPGFWKPVKFSYHSNSERNFDHLYEHHYFGTVPLCNLPFEHSFAHAWWFSFFVIQLRELWRALGRRSINLIMKTRGWNYIHLDEMDETRTRCVMCILQYVNLSSWVILSGIGEMWIKMKILSVYNFLVPAYRYLKKIIRLLLFHFFVSSRYFCLHLFSVEW